jgi:hypothetical protein
LKLFSLLLFFFVGFISQTFFFFELTPSLPRSFWSPSLASCTAEKTSSDIRSEEQEKKNSNKRVSQTSATHAAASSSTMPRAARRSNAALAAAATFLFSLALFSPSSSLVSATYTAKELDGEGKIEIQALQDIFNYNLGPTKEQQKAAVVQTSDYLPDLPAYGLPGPCGTSPDVVKTKITVKCPDFDEFKKVLGFKNITLKVTMTLPGKAANGRAAPWPVIFIYAGFSVSGFSFFFFLKVQKIDAAGRLEPLVRCL